MMSDDVKKKQMRARQAMITEAIDLEVFEDRDDVKRWMKEVFKLKLPIEKISTEYTLSAKQMKLFYIWLRYFTRRGKKPRINRSNPKVTDAQKFKILDLQAELNFTPKDLADFINRQVGKRKLIGSLFKDEATKLITGMEQILKDNQAKKNHE